MRVTVEGANGQPMGTVDSFGNPSTVFVNNGQVTAFTTLSAAAGNTTGTTMDCGASHQVVTYVCVGTGTLAGTLTLELSLDGTTWVSSGSTISLTAGLTSTASTTGKAARYWRVSLSGSSGTGTVTVKIMANG